MVLKKAFGVKELLYRQNYKFPYCTTRSHLLGDVASQGVNYSPASGDDISLWQWRHHHVSGQEVQLLLIRYGSALTALTFYAFVKPSYTFSLQGRKQLPNPGAFMYN